MGALLGDLTVVEHDDAVAEFATAHAVGDVDGGLVSHEGIEVLIDVRFCDRI